MNAALTQFRMYPETRKIADVTGERGKAGDRDADTTFQRLSRSKNHRIVENERRASARVYLDVSESADFGGLDWRSVQSCDDTL